MEVPPPTRKLEAALLEASGARADARDERHVVDVGDDVVVLLGRECGLELAREDLGVLVPDEPAGEGREVGSGGERLRRVDAEHGRGAHVPHDVAAGLARHEPGLAQYAHALRRVGELQEVNLDVLTRRHVPLLERREARDNLAERVDLVGREGAGRYLDAHHLHVGLTLAVHAPDEPEHDELVLRVPLAVQEPRGFGLEVVGLLGNIGKHALGVVVACLVVHRLNATDDGAFRGRHVVNPLTLAG